MTPRWTWRAGIARGEFGLHVSWADFPEGWCVTFIVGILMVTLSHDRWCPAHGGVIGACAGCEADDARRYEEIAS